MADYMSDLGSSLVSLVWMPDAEDVWSVAELVGTDDANHTLIKLKDKTEHKVPVKTHPKLLPVVISTIRNISSNLIWLEDLTDGAILHQIRSRFEGDKIYTNVGSFLIIVNPFKQIPIYGFTHIKSWHNAGPLERSTMEPHIFGVAAKALRNMNDYNFNQSIVITGVSGAGKTEAAKSIIRYLGEVTGVASGEKILLMNPILESFGNAKTVRNNNSSRFGKWMEIGFDKKGVICGARVINYLLEKTRVTTLSADERNYHIFYQLCAGSSSEEKKRMRIKGASAYKYLRRSGCYEIPRVDDAADYKEVVGGMRNMGFKQDLIGQIMGIVAAVLHLGNIEFDSIKIRKKGDVDVEGCVVKATTAADLQNASTMLEIDPKELEKSLCYRETVFGKETMSIPLQASNALSSADALAKALYGELFDWIIRQMNLTLYKKLETERVIGILDIFGFEVFEVNSFEQFCINYANEKLQNYMNYHIFATEQNEYTKEGISVLPINYTDNKPCIDLFEKPPQGIIPTLTEEVIMKSNDESFISKLHKFHGDKKAGHPNYATSLKSPHIFVIKHFCSSVSYTVDGFVAKNQDYLHESLRALLARSKSKLIAMMLLPDDSDDGAGDSPKPKSPKGEHTSKKSIFGGLAMSPRASILGFSSSSGSSSNRTISNSFMQQLGDLMKNLKATEAHYVRCIRPNESNSPNVFDANVMNEQLKNSSIYETVKLRRMGFCYRIRHRDFLSRYAICSDDKHMQASKFLNLSEEALSEKCNDLLTNLKAAHPDLKAFVDGWQNGKTKVFMNEAMHPLLENLRVRNLMKFIVQIQKFCRAKTSHKKKAHRQRVNDLILASITTRNADNIRSTLADAFGDLEEISDDAHEHYPALTVAKALLSQLEGEERTEESLRAAADECNDIIELDAILSQAREFLASTDSAASSSSPIRALVDLCQKKYLRLVAMGDCLRSLEKALSESDLEALEGALNTARANGVEESFLKEHLVKVEELRTYRVVDRDLKMAINGRDAARLEALLGQPGLPPAVIKSESFVKGTNLLKVMKVEKGLEHDFAVATAAHNNKKDAFNNFRVFRNGVRSITVNNLQKDELKECAMKILEEMMRAHPSIFRFYESIAVGEDYFSGNGPLTAAIDTLVDGISLGRVLLLDKNSGITADLIKTAQGVLDDLLKEREAVSEVNSTMERLKEFPNVYVALDVITDALNNVKNKSNPHIKHGLEAFEDLTKLVEMSNDSVKQAFAVSQSGSGTLKVRAGQLNSIIKMSEKLGLTGALVEKGRSLHRQLTSDPSTSLPSSRGNNHSNHHNNNNNGGEDDGDQTEDGEHQTVDFAVKLLSKAVNHTGVPTARILLLQSAVECARLVGLGTDVPLMISAISLILELRRDCLLHNIDIPPPPGLGFSDNNIVLHYEDEERINALRTQLKMAVDSRDIETMRKTVKGVSPTITYLPELTHCKNILTRYDKGEETLGTLKAALISYERNKLKSAIPKIEVLNIVEYLTPEDNQAYKKALSIVNEMSAQQYYRDSIREAIAEENTAKIRVILNKAAKCGEFLGNQWEKDKRMATLLLEGEESLIRGRGKSVLFSSGSHSGRMSSLDQGASAPSLSSPTAAGGHGPGHKKVKSIANVLSFQRNITDWRNFVHLRTPGNYAKRLFFKGKTKALMFRWCYDVIPRSLYAFESKQPVQVGDNTTLSISKFAIELFKSLQIVMGDRYHEYPILMAHEIVSQGYLVESVRDEIYLQLLKQTSVNPSKHSTLKGWKMIILCLMNFPPSAAFADYLKSYIYAHTIMMEEVKKWDGENTYDGVNKADETTIPICKYKKVKKLAQKALMSFEEINKYGPSSIFPSLSKAEAVFESKRTVATVYLPDGTAVNVAIPVSRFMMRVTELLHYIIPMTGLTAEEALTYCCFECIPLKLQENAYISVSKKERMLTNREPVIDVIQSWGRLRKGGDDGYMNYVLMLKKAIFSRRDNYSATEAYYIQNQLAGDFAGGRYIVDDSTACYIFALQLLINKTKDKKLAVDLDDGEYLVKILLDKYIPAINRESSSDLRWWIENAKQYLQDFEGRVIVSTELSLQEEYIEFMKTLPGFGSIEFQDVEQATRDDFSPLSNPQRKSGKSSDMHRLVLREDSLSIFKGSDVAATITIPLYDIVSYNDEGDRVSLKVNNGKSSISTDYTFITERSQEFVQSIYSFSKRAFAKKVMEKNESHMTLGEVGSEFSLRHSFREAIGSESSLMSSIGSRSFSPNKSAAMAARYSKHLSSRPKSLQEFDKQAGDAIETPPPPGVLGLKKEEAAPKRISLERLEKLEQRASRMSEWKSNNTLL